MPPSRFDDVFQNFVSRNCISHVDREPCLLLMCLSALDAFFHTAQIATPTPALPRARNVMLNENNL